MTSNKSDKVTKILLTAAGVGICTYLLIRHRKSIANKFENVKNLILYDFAKVQRKSFSVHVVNDANECGNIINLLKEHCKTFNVIGFDCEWVTVNNARRKVALIQLCSEKGLCALFRVCKFNKIPQELRQILEDPEIIKVGIASTEDSTKLLQDYAIKVNGTFDIRFLALIANFKAEGLGKLSKSVLNIELDKNWRITCSDWESPTLSKAQIDYAAKDAFVAVEIFKKLYKIARPNMSNPVQISQFCDQYTDIGFKNKMAQMSFESMNGEKSDGKLLNKRKDMKMMKRAYTKSKNLYDNCYLQAPDGTLLCTCDKRKAEWYIVKGLGTEIEREPTFTVRLNFQPSGMPVGDVGEYYQSKKENICVVCGKDDELIRKNVVPHEYRKHFPSVMKDKTSHDILLLCFHCHQISNITDIKIRKMLEAKCDAPIYELPQNEEDLKRFRYIQRLARALVSSKSVNIPDYRKAELRQKIQDAYPNDELTTEFLEQIVNESEPLAEHKTAHGVLVVEYFKKNEGLIELEKIFRQHFLDTMQPKYMPKLWNINHNANRLGIRALEHRIDPIDLEFAGVDEKMIKNIQNSVLNQSEIPKITLNSNSNSHSNSLKEDDSDSISMTSFHSAAGTLNGSDRINQTEDERYFSDSMTIASFYETIRSEDSANLTDFQSFENSSEDDSDTSTAVGSPIHTDTEIEDVVEN